MIIMRLSHRPCKSIKDFSREKHKGKDACDCDIVCGFRRHYGLGRRRGW